MRLVLVCLFRPFARILTRGEKCCRSIRVFASHATLSCLERPRFALLFEAGHSCPSKHDVAHALLCMLSLGRGRVKVANGADHAPRAHTRRQSGALDNPERTSCARFPAESTLPPSDGGSTRAGFGGGGCVGALAGTGYGEPLRGWLQSADIFRPFFPTAATFVSLIRRGDVSSCC